MIKNISYMTVGFISLTLISCTNTSSNQNDRLSVNETETETAAVRTHVTQKGQQELQKAIAASIHQSQIVLSINALLTSDTLFIERRMLLGNDHSRPIVFKLLKKNKQCVLLNQTKQQRYLLTQTTCRAYTKQSL